MNPGQLERATVYTGTFFADVYKICHLHYVTGFFFFFFLFCFCFVFSNIIMVLGTKGSVCMLIGLCFIMQLEKYRICLLVSDLFTSPY